MSLAMRKARENHRLNVLGYLHKRADDAYMEELELETRWDCYPPDTQDEK